MDHKETGFLVACRDNAYTSCALSDRRGKKRDESRHPRPATRGKPVVVAVFSVFGSPCPMDRWAKHIPGIRSIAMRLRTLSVVALVSLVVFPACRTAGTYSERGEHVELMKRLLQHYADAEWYAYGSAYADSALIFVNSTSPMTLEDRLASHRAQRALFDDVSIVDPLIGEVHNADGELWVLVWGSWIGRVKDTAWQVSVPVHIAARFSGGRVDQEWVYMDQAPLEVAALEAAVLEAVSAPDSSRTSMPEASPSPQP